jgi:hypothetical protein
VKPNFAWYTLTSGGRSTEGSRARGGGREEEISTIFWKIAENFLIFQKFWIIQSAFGSTLLQLLNPRVVSRSRARGRGQRDSRVRTPLVLRRTPLVLRCTPPYSARTPEYWSFAFSPLIKSHFATQIFLLPMCLVTPLLEQYSKRPIQKVRPYGCLLNNSRTKKDNDLQFSPFDTRESGIWKYAQTWLVY